MTHFHKSSIDINDFCQMFIFVKKIFSSFISKIQHCILEPIYMTKRMMECGSKVGEMTSSHHQYYTQWLKTES